MSPSPGIPRFTVACGIVARGGKVLMGRRGRGSHLEGTWEFPGGKVEEGESPADALRRELVEELSLAVTRPVLFHRTEHVYPERAVELWFYLCPDAAGEPRAGEHQELRWVGTDELRSLPTPAANRDVIRRIEERLG